MITQAGRLFRQNLTIFTNQLQTEAIDVVADIVEKHVKKNISERVGGQGKAFDNSSFSDYRSKSHMRKRRKAGLQVNNKNFRFSGGMIDSVKLKKKTIFAGGAQFSYGFTGVNSDADRPRSRGKANYKIASYHSANENINLMQQSAEEKQEMVNEVLFYFKEKLRLLK